MKPAKSCPLCGQKHHTKDQVIDCMGKNLKEEKAKNRRLIPIAQYKLTHA